MARSILLKVSLSSAKFFGLNFESVLYHVIKGSSASGCSSQNVLSLLLLTTFTPRILGHFALICKLLLKTLKLEILNDLKAG